MSSYRDLAGDYDILTADVNYTHWASYVRWHFSRLNRPVRTVLDLACGTGSLTRVLAEWGYELTGVDQSEDMLALAEEKCRELDKPPRFFCQDMCELRIPEPVDACVCCLDSVNYVLKPENLRRAFRRVYNALEPGGLFLFDVDTPEKLMAMDGQVFLDETEDVFCVWRGEYSERRRICSFWMDLFEKHGEVWRRSGELHREYAYSMEQLTEFLGQAGFTSVKRYGDLSRHRPKEGAQRVFFAARKAE